jgi:hypothetical protein
VKGVQKGADVTLVGRASSAIVSGAVGGLCVVQPAQTVGRMLWLTLLPVLPQGTHLEPKGPVCAGRSELVGNEHTLQDTTQHSMAQHARVHAHERNVMAGCKHQQALSLTHAPPSTTCPITHTCQFS